MGVGGDTVLRSKLVRRKNGQQFTLGPNLSIRGAASGSRRERRRREIRWWWRQRQLLSVHGWAFTLSRQLLHSRSSESFAGRHKKAR
jgi:hypothetical protein